MATKEKVEKLPEIDFSQDAGAGLQGVTLNDLAKPFLVILQKMSPQVDDTNGSYIRGAKAGMLFNTVTKELFDGKEGIYFIPTAFTSMLVEWKTREAGGGLVAMHAKEEEPNILPLCSRNEKNQLINKAGNLIAPTAYWYGKYMDKEGNTQFAVIAMASTQLKHSKKWLSSIMSIKMKDSQGRSFTPACYAHQYKLTTAVEQNEHGSWYGWKIENAGVLKSQELVLECREHSKQVSTGQLLLTSTPEEVPAEGTDAKSVKEY